MLERSVVVTPCPALPGGTAGASPCEIALRLFWFRRRAKRTNATRKKIVSPAKPPTTPPTTAGVATREPLPPDTSREFGVPAGGAPLLVSEGSPFPAPPNITPSVEAIRISDEEVRDGCVEIDVMNEDAVDFFRELVKDVLLRVLLPLEDLSDNVVGLAEDDERVEEVVLVTERLVLGSEVLLPTEVVFVFDEGANGTNQYLLES